MRTKWWIVPVVLALGAETLWAQQPARTPPAWKGEFQRARQAWERGDTERAFALLERALTLAPDNLARAQVAFRYADWAHQLGRYSVARQWYERCLAYAPPDMGLVRRASEGLSRLPPMLPPSAPPPLAAPSPRAVPFTAPEAGFPLTTPLAVTFLVLLLGGLLLLQWASGWKTQAFLAQVLLGLLLAGAVVMMLPLVLLAASQELVLAHDSWLAAVLTLGSIGCLMFAARSWQQGQLLRNTPLARLRSASHGFLKVRGVAQPAFGVVTSQVGKISAIYLSEVSEQYVRHTERYYDSQSKSWKTRTVYRWETIYSAAPRVNFVLDDGTGSAVVEVQGAEFYPDHLALFYNYQPVRSFPWFAHVGDVRTRVHYIPPHATVTVWGRYYEHDLPGTARDEMRLQYDRFHKCMVVLEGHESKVYSARTGGGLALAIIGLVMALGVIYLLLHPGVVTEYLETF